VSIFKKWFPSWYAPYDPLGVFDGTNKVLSPTPEAGSTPQAGWVPSKTLIAFAKRYRSDGVFLWLYSNKGKVKIKDVYKYIETHTEFSMYGCANIAKDNLAQILWVALLKDGRLDGPV